MNVGPIDFKCKYTVKTPCHEEWERMKVNFQTFSNSTRDDGDKAGERSVSYRYLQEKSHSNQRD
jgi:hypothetical protein